MMKALTISAAALVAGLAVAGSTTSASANHRSCGHCGPVAPVTHYKIVHPNIFKTRYHDVSVYRHVQRVRRITNVTQVQPVVHTHLVTRVHHHTVVAIRDQYRSVTEHLPPISVVTRSTQNFYDCGCGY